MAANNTLDQAVLLKRIQAIKIIRYGFDDAGLDTVLSDGATNGFADGLVYSTATPDI